MDKTGIRFEIRPEDTLEEADVGLYEHIRQAVAKATAEGIKANSIVLNSNLVKVPEIFGMSPHMICGLRAYVTELELPDGYAFSVQDDRMDSKPVTNGDWIRSMTDKELAGFLGKEDICGRIQGSGPFCDDRAVCEGCVEAWLGQPAELEDGA